MSAWYSIDMPYDYGSQYQLRRWVLERTDELNAYLRGASPTLDEWVDDIAWIAPVAEDHHELRDEAWSAAGLPTPSPQDAGWWPQRGPVWDAVAKATGRDGQAGAIFVRRRAANLSSALGDQGPLIGRASARSARRLPTFRPQSRRPSAPTGWDPLISRRTGWRCCTSLAANASRPCPSGWSPVRVRRALQVRQRDRRASRRGIVAADHPVPARRDGAATRTHRPVRLVDRAVPPSIGTAGADDAASNMGAMSERERSEAG